jgi:hypothetical protein
MIRKTHVYPQVLASTRVTPILSSLGGEGGIRRQLTISLRSFLCGEGGIRTHGGRKPSTVFKTVAFDHSATSPRSYCTHA